MTNNEVNPRSLAITVLEDVMKGSYSNLQLNTELENSNLIETDRHLATEIVYGTLQHLKTIDFYLAGYLRDPQELPIWVANVLRTAIFQIEYLDRVPDFAILDEAIKITKKRGSDGQRRLVTGVLRNYLRKGHSDISKIENQTDRWAIEYSVETWLVKKLIQELGHQKTELILKSINQPARLSIRVNQLVTTKTELINQLINVGYDVLDSAVSQAGLILSNGPSIANSLDFKKGAFTVQDESAMLVIESMNLTAGMTVLDACAAPGGKTTQIAEYVGPDGHVDAWDIYKKRVALVNKNAFRMHANHIVKGVVHDATQPYDGVEYDRILVDAPCSGLGLLRRKPEVRYFKEANDSKKLHQLQMAILNNVAKLVKVGGQITYSTCTIVSEENQATVQAFLKQHPNFELTKVTTKLSIKSDRKELDLNIYPDDFGSDGFYIANLKRVR